MLIEEALYTYLKADVNLSSLVSDRIYPMVMPQDSAMPTIVYQKVSCPRVHSMGKDPGLAYPRFQFSCWGETYSSAKDLAKKLQVALQDYRGLMAGGVEVQASIIENEQDVYEPDTSLFCVPLDFTIWHKE